MGEVERQVEAQQQYTYYGYENEGAFCNQCGMRGGKHRDFCPFIVIVEVACEMEAQP